MAGDTFIRVGVFTSETVAIRVATVTAHYIGGAHPFLISRRVYVAMLIQPRVFFTVSILIFILHLFIVSHERIS